MTPRPLDSRARYEDVERALVTARVSLWSMIHLQH